MTEQEKKELLDELEKRMDEKYKGCLTREDVATTLKAPREKWFRDENGNGWIPVSERLPESSGTYQVTCMDGRIYRSTYAKFQSRLKRWELTGARAYWKVTAWRPLPKPYKED